MAEGPVSLDEAWRTGYSWMQTETLAPTAVWAAMLLKAADFDQNKAAELAASVLTVSMVATSYAIGMSPRTLAEQMFAGLVDDDNWPKVEARISKFIADL